MRGWSLGVMLGVWADLGMRTTGSGPPNPSHSSTLHTNLSFKGKGKGDTPLGVDYLSFNLLLKALRCALLSPCRYLFYLDSLAGTEEVIRTFNFDAALVRAATQVPQLSQPVLDAVGRVLLEVIQGYALGLQWPTYARQYVDRMGRWRRREASVQVCALHAGTVHFALR